MYGYRIAANSVCPKFVSAFYSYRIVTNSVCPRFASALYSYRTAATPFAKGLCLFCTAIGQLQFCLSKVCVRFVQLLDSGKHFCPRFCVCFIQLWISFKPYLLKVCVCFAQMWDIDNPVCPSVFVRFVLYPHSTHCTQRNVVVHDFLLIKSSINSPAG